MTMISENRAAQTFRVEMTSLELVNLLILMQRGLDISRTTGSEDEFIAWAEATCSDIRRCIIDSMTADEEN